MQKTIYFNDELNDEFSAAEIAPKRIDESYVYIYKSLFKKFTRFFWYRLIAIPLAWLYLKLAFHHKIVNKTVLKSYKMNGYFLFGNHTQATADAFIPTMVSFPKSTYVIVHANNVSMPILGKINPSLGALPLPDTLSASKNFAKAIETRFNQKCSIAIYPEAHIWPYYTKIRPFKETSFRYPIMHNSPIFCFTNTYQKRRFSKKPKLITYIDGPFLPDATKPLKEEMQSLRNSVYQTMVDRSKNSTVEIIKYIRKVDI